MSDSTGNADDLNFDADASAEPHWAFDEIERLYQQALDAVEAVADDLNAATASLSTANPADHDAAANIGDSISETAPDDGAESDPRPAVNPIAVTIATAADERIAPAQVIEALLFVGGQPLSAKRICTALRGEFDADFVERAIDAVNQRYARQKRPYEIRLGEGGYRLALRPEFEPVRNRVYGLGPKDVRLSQDVLEILAVVAYRQPISRTAVEEIGKRNAGAHLRQLLRRELVVIDRGESRDSEITYRTTPRFLQLFGLGRLDDLPQVEDLNFK